MDVTSEAVAREILEVIPAVMRTIRTEMRSHRSADLTVPLFRTLLFLERRPGVSLQDLARHLGLTSPTVCKMIDGLEAHALVKRQPAKLDHRKIALRLTPGGKAVLDKARTNTQAALADLLARLSKEQCATVSQALQILSATFLPGGDGTAHDEVSS